MPYGGGHNDERVACADMLRPLFFGKTQDLRQARLGLGDGPDAMGLGHIPSNRFVVV